LGLKQLMLFMIDIEEDQEEDRKRYSKLTLLRKRKLLSLEQERPLHCLTVADVRTKVIVAVTNDVIGHAQEMET